MAVEIELKARVEDPEALRGRLSALAEFRFSFTREDRYWLPREPLPGLPPSGVRIRGETRGDSPAETVRVTYKTKEVRDRIEINEEREFTVSDRAPLEELLRRLGLEPGAGKTKRGWCWSAGPLTAELSLVGGLGWFLELEILTEDRGEETLLRAREGLLSFLQRAGIGEDRIEERYYTELLRQGPGQGAAGDCG
jgi:adenylate cyclase class 2